MSRSAVGVIFSPRSNAYFKEKTTVVLSVRLCYTLYMAYRDWPVVGHTEAIDFFEYLLAYERREGGRIGGTYILNGLPGIGKRTVLDVFLSRLLDNKELSAGSTPTFFSDVVHLERLEDKREIGIEQVREFSARLALSSYAGPYRIGIVTGADTLSVGAANAILKTLEDARDQILIFLLASSVDQLPATIASRSQVINFHNVATNDIYEWLIEKQGMSRPAAKNVARLAAGRPGLALALAEDKELLAKTLEPARVLYSVLSAPLYERWQLINALVGKTKVAVETVAAVISSWQLAARDLLLLRLNQPDLVMHAFLDVEARAAADRLSVTDIRRLEKTFATAATYLAANVNPKLVLEQAVMNIS